MRKIILGNPPFQDKKDKSKGRKLYLDITKKMLDLNPEEMIFLTPSTIANIKKKRLSLDQLYGLKEVDYTVNEYFNVGVFIILFHLRKDYNDLVKIINEDNTIYYKEQLTPMLQEKDIVPSNLFNKIKDKGSKQQDKLFIGDVSSNKKRKDKKDEKYKYRVNVNILKNKVQYTYVKPKLYKKKKLIIHMGKVYNKDNCLISTENFGQYQNMIDIDDYTDEQIENLKSFLFNDITVLICKKFREFYKIGFNNIIYFFNKYIDKNKKYSTDDVIKYFDLTKDELDYLYSKNTINYIKKEYTEKNYSKDRNKRVKESAEIFTPPELVQKMLDLLDIDWNNIPDDIVFIDPASGSGNFLIELAKRGVLVKNLYGVDIMPDNVEMTKKRLREIYGDTEEVNFHLNRNIICADALTYHYKFWWHDDFI